MSHLRAGAQPGGAPDEASEDRAAASGVSTSATHRSGAKPRPGAPAGRPV